MLEAKKAGLAFGRYARNGLPVLDSTPASPVRMRETSVATETA